MISFTKLAISRKPLKDEIKIACEDLNIQFKKAKTNLIIFI